MKYFFNTKFFQKQIFSKQSIDKYSRAISENLRIASNSIESKVIFEFSYSALIKVGIKLIASFGYKVKSREGHHIKIIEAMSKILNEPNIEIIGNKMRQKRNFDLYEGYIIIGKKEAEQYLIFVKDIVKKIENYLKSQPTPFE